MLVPTVFAGDLKQEIFLKKGYFLLNHDSGLGTKSFQSCDHLNCVIVMTDLV
jgi:hypothetical protein